ncbi:MAG: hypothetical protein AAFU79_05135 [Myxococcota bacterium]
MAYICIQLRGIRMTRKRTGEDLSDPVSELEDGDGEASEAVVFVHPRQVHANPDLFIESQSVSLGVRETLSPRLKVEAVAGADLRLGKEATETFGRLSDPSDDPGGPQGEDSEPPGKDLRTWLQDWAEAASGGGEAGSLRTAVEVPGARMRFRFGVDGPGAFSMAASLEPPLPRSASMPTARKEAAAGRSVVLRGSGTLHAGGRLEDVRLELEDRARSTPQRDRALSQLERLAPEEAGREVERRRPREPDLGLDWMAREMARLPLARFDGGTGPTLSGLLSGGPSTREEPRLSLDWDDQGEPKLAVSIGDAAVRDAPEVMDILDRIARYMSAASTST